MTAIARRAAVDVRKLRALQYVRRFNFERCNRYQSVAEHSAMVAVLCLDAALAMEWGWIGAKEAAVYGLMHDAPEAVTGDIPFLVKRRMDRQEVLKLDLTAEIELGLPDFGESSVAVKSLVYYCDAVELALYLQEEISSGNVSLHPVLYETYGRLARSEWYARGGPLASWTMNVLGLDAVDDLDSMSKPLPSLMKH